MKQKGSVFAFSEKIRINKKLAMVRGRDEGAFRQLMEVIRLYIEYTDSGVDASRINDALRREPLKAFDCEGFKELVAKAA